MNDSSTLTKVMNPSEFVVFINYEVPEDWYPVLNASVQLFNCNGCLVFWLADVFSVK